MRRLRDLPGFGELLWARDVRWCSNVRRPSFVCQHSDLRLGADLLERTVVSGLDNLRRNDHLSGCHLSHGYLRPMGHV